MSNDLNKEEEIQHRSFNGRLLIKLLSYLKPHKKRVLLSFVTIAFAAFFSQIGPLLTQIAVDEMLAWIRAL